MKLSKIANISTTIVRREATLTYTMQRFLRYMSAFGESYGVRFVGVLVLDIVEDMMFSNILSSNSGDTYIRHIRVGRMKVKHQGMLPLLAKLCIGDQVRKNSGITQLDHANIYISCEEYILLVIHAADEFVNNDHKPVPFHANDFYRHGQALLD